MALDSYAGLKTEIAEYLDRDDLTDFIDGFIDLAEGRHRRELRIRGMIRRSQAELSDRYLALPPGFRQMKFLRFASARVGALDEVTLNELEKHRLDTAGTPRFYTVHEEIEFDRAPGSSTALEMIFYGELTPLSADFPSNAMLVEAPDAYLYASLAAASPFLSDDERIATWEGGYQRVKAEIERAERLARHGGALASRVAGSAP